MNATPKSSDPGIVIWTQDLPAEGSISWNRPGCYALRVLGDHLQPRYRAGEYLIAREETPIEGGVDVLAVLEDGSALIGELTSIRDGYAALNTADGRRTTVPLTSFKILHRIVGRADATEVDHAEN